MKRKQGKNERETDEETHLTGVTFMFLLLKPTSALTTVHFL